MNPLRAAQAYGDSYPVIEFATWPSASPSQRTSGLWDTVNMVPARLSRTGYAAGNPAPAVPADLDIAEYNPPFPDPRWILDYFVFAEGMHTSNDNARTEFVIEVRASVWDPNLSTAQGGGIAPLTTLALIPLTGERATFQLATNPGGILMRGPGRRGTLRGTARFLEVVFRWAGTAAGVFQAGVYQRAW